MVGLEGHDLMEYGDGAASWNVHSLFFFGECYWESRMVEEMDDLLLSLH